MSGFDQAWLTKHCATKGVKASVQAGVGAVQRGVMADPAYIEAQHGKNAQLTAMVERLADPFAPVDVSAGVTLVLPYPPSGNHYKGERIIPATKEKAAYSVKFLTEDAKIFKAEVQRRALMAGICQPFPWRVIVEGQLYPRRPLDWEKRAAKDPEGWDDTVMCLDVADNTPKVTLDALQGVVYVNDKFIRKATFEKMEPDSQGARLVVTIKPIVRVDPRGSLF